MSLPESHSRAALETGAWEDFVSRHRVLAVGALVLVALTVRLIHLDRGMWNDELTTWRVAMMPWAEMFENRFDEGHLPLYFIFTRFWIHWFGSIDWVMRLPCVLMGVWSVYLVLRLGQQGYAPRVAWLAAALMTFHANDLWASQIVRMYSLLSCTALFASLMLLRLEQTRGWRHGAGLFAASAVGLLTHPLYAFFMAGQTLYLVWSGGKRWLEPWKSYLMMLAAGVAVSPVWMLLASNQGTISAAAKKGQVSVERMFKYSLRAVMGDYDLVDYGSWMRAPAAICLTVAVGAVLWALFRRGGVARMAPAAERSEADAEEYARSRRLTRYIVCVVGAFFLVVFIFSNVIQSKVHIRYFAPVTGLICLGLAGAVFTIANPRLRRLYLSILAATLLLVTVAWWIYPGDGLRRALEYIESHRAGDERVVGCNDSSTRSAYRFYVPEALDMYTGLPRKELDPTESEKVLRDNAPTGKGLWLLIYHEKQSPVEEVAETLLDFEVLERREIGDAKVLHLKRIAANEGFPENP